MTINISTFKCFGIVDIFINRATDPVKNMFHWNAEIGLCLYISIQNILMWKNSVIQPLVSLVLAWIQVSWQP